MRIKREALAPVTPPPVFQMKFSRDEGWAIVGALREYAAAHPHAAHCDEWTAWSTQLDLLLREGL